jgi:hypothetical protein
MRSPRSRCGRFQSLCCLLSLLLLAALDIGCGSNPHTAASGSGPSSPGATTPAKTLSSIAVTPSIATVAPSVTQQFTATASYSDGSTAAVTSTASWTTSAAGVATVNSAGLATAVAAGAATITASLSGVSGTAMLTVTPAALGPPTLASIAISPATATVAAGAAQQFAATATYSDSSTANATATASWTSTAPAVATINASGLATGVAAGSTTITASLSGVNSTATLTVPAPPPGLVSFAVTPANASFAMGSTQQFTATATYSNGSTNDATSTANWTAANTAVATIGSSGLATGVASGTTTITASLNGASGNVPATVTIVPGTAVNVATWHFDTNRSGLNPGEQSLSPSNVSAQSFGKLFSYLVDGYVYGEPLLVSNVSINGAKHNALYVATENDSVYAFDADGNGTPLWQVSLLQTGETPITDAPIQPVEGVTSTPVVDPATNTLYVVSAETSSATGGTFRLHALDIASGAERFGGPVTLLASMPGTGSGGATVSLTTSCIQRAALLLANGNVYVGFGGCPRGWLLAYSASTLAQVGLFNSSPNLNGEGAYASAGGIWMGGGGPVADSSGNVYVVTGNGPWDGQTAFSDSILKFSPSLQLEDYFTPYDYQYMDCADADLASGGLLLIPGTTELLAGGKTGTMYLVNSANMGHELPYTDLRDWIKQLDKAGELKRIREAVSPVPRDGRDRRPHRQARQRHPKAGGPALLFENVTGYPGARS